MPTLYLIRHAQPVVPEYVNHYPGPDLGEEGHRQARWIAEILLEKEIQQIFASDYPRVLQSLRPLTSYLPSIRVRHVRALWEREPTIETHESLVARVHEWFSNNKSEILSTTTAIFAHCGPINMILEYLDPDKTQLQYPYTSAHGCHTPCAGIWEIQFTKEGINGQLILPSPTPTKSSPPT